MISSSKVRRFFKACVDPPSDERLPLRAQIVAVLLLNLFIKQMVIFARFAGCWTGTERLWMAKPEVLRLVGFQLSAEFGSRHEQLLLLLLRETFCLRHEKVNEDEARGGEEREDSEGARWMQRAVKEFWGRVRLQ